MMGNMMMVWMKFVVSVMMMKVVNFVKKMMVYLSKYVVVVMDEN